MGRVQPFCGIKRVKQKNKKKQKIPCTVFNRYYIGYYLITEFFPCGRQIFGIFFFFAITTIRGYLYYYLFANFEYRFKRKKKKNNVILRTRPPTTTIITQSTLVAILRRKSTSVIIFFAQYFTEPFSVFTGKFVYFISFTQSLSGTYSIVSVSFSRALNRILSFRK